MIYDRKKINDHPAHQRADDGLFLSRPASYYVQVLRQNLHHFFEQVPVDPCEVVEEEVLRGTVFMVEEAMEYSSAKTLEGKLDALVDIVIVALGRAAFHGFHRFDDAMARVIRANKEKIPGSSPGRGEWSRDLSKPEGWEPAYLSDLVQPVPIISSRPSDDGPLDENETEILDSYLRRRLTEPHSQVVALTAEKEHLVETIKAHDEKENLSARVITDLRKKVVNLTTERDQSNLDWGAMCDRLIQVETERDDLSERLTRVKTVRNDLSERLRQMTTERNTLVSDRDTKQLERNSFREERNTVRKERDEARAERDNYQGQLRDEISRCHELRGSNENLREKLFGIDAAATMNAHAAREETSRRLDEIHGLCVDSDEGGFSLIPLGPVILTETLQRVINLRKKFKTQVFSDTRSCPSLAERDRMNLFYEAETVLADVELNADSPMRTPVQVEHAPPRDESLIKLDNWLEEPAIKLDQIHPILLECAQLLNRKGQDYGNQDHTKERYHPLGHHSYIQMMHNKMTRIRHTALELKPGQTLNFDSVRDSVLDLINYAAFYGAWLEELEKTDVEERSG